MKGFILLCLYLAFFFYSCNNQKGSKAEFQEGLSTMAQKVRPGFLMGSFYTPGHHNLAHNNPDNDTIKAFIKKNYNIITVGIFMFAVQRDSGIYDPQRLANIDNTVAFASDNNIKVYFHLLIGGANYSPEWINKGHFTKDELREIMRERITTILTRYKGRVHYVDVVNEALDSGNISADGEFDWRKDDGKGEHVWMTQMGMWHGKKYKFPQYLVDAFNISREVGGEGLKLILNEFENETTVSSKGNTFFTLVKAMRDEGIPVDGAGMQIHCKIKNGKFYEWGETEFDFNAFNNMLKLYEESGIDVHITELDIHLPQNPSEEDFKLQGIYYREILRTAISSPAVKSLKTWGFTDKYAWKINGIQSYPVIIDENFKPKSAYLEWYELLKSLSSVKKE